MSCVDVYEGVTCSIVQTVHLSAHKSLAVVETKIELCSHVDTVVGNNCLIVYDMDMIPKWNQSMLAHSKPQ